MATLIFSGILCVFIMRVRTEEAVQLNYEIQEELAPNTFIGNVAEDARLWQRYDGSTLSKLRFSFLSQPQLDKTYFAIEDSTGIIRTMARIDRDKMCPQQEHCVVTFDIAVRPVEYLIIIKVNLEILDINDNQPLFQEWHILHEISEASVPGTSFIIPTAVDPDSGLNTIQDYELVSSTRHFKLEVIRKTDGSTDLQLVLQEKLDREVRDFYQMKVVAYDGGEPRRSGSVLVDITVLDTNDNKPEFENATYEVSINENIPIGRTIVKVRAIDQDSGLNGEVEYRFSVHTLQNYADLFKINKHTGEVFIVGSVDYEVGSIYLLSVEAHDKGADSMPAEATVIVRVSDVNDNAPVISINTLTSSADAEVAENSPLGTFVAHVSVVDADDKNNGRVSCFLSNKNFKLHKLDSTEFKIVTTKKFDREEKSEQAISLTCQDRGNPTQVSVTDIVVRILDENDNVPHFQNDIYSVVMKENNPVGASIITVQAADRDANDNGRVRYSLEASAKELVDIDEDTGEIMAKVMFDFETVERFDFRVFATDHSNSRQTATAMVELIVTDTNDARPEFKQDSYSFGVLENEPVNTEVGSVQAFDTDSAPFNHFTFHVDSSHGETPVFAINPETGTITTKAVLDRENRSRYELIISAVSSDDLSSSSTTSVSIFVADKNDNAPVFSFPNHVNQTVQVSNTAPLGHVVAQLQAHDQDMGVNARLSYHIISGNTGEAFAIDSSSGVITVDCDLDYLVGEEFQLGVLVQDSGDDLLSSKAKLYMVIRDGDLLARETAATTSFFLPTNVLIIIFAFVMAAVLVAIVFTVVIVVVVRRRKRKFHPPVDGAEPPGKQQPNGGTGHCQNGTKANPNPYVTAVNIDKMASTNGEQTTDSLTWNYETSPTSTSSQKILPALPHWYPSPPDSRRPLSPDYNQHQMKQSSTLPKHMSGHVNRPLSPLKSPAKTRSGSLEVNFPTQNPLLSPREDTEILSFGSISNSDSGRGNSSEEGDNNVAVVAFIATDYVRACPEKHAPKSKGADYVPLIPVVPSASSSGNDHHSGQSMTEHKRPHSRRQRRDVNEPENADSASKFIKPLPEKRLECGSKGAVPVSAPPPHGRKTESRGVCVDSSMLASGRYVGYDAVDTSI